MNIFRLDDDPALAAKYHCDKHVNKMLLECVQICNVALSDIGLEERTFYDNTHEGHTTIEWVKESGGNFKYALKLIAGLNKEKRYRYGSGNHSSYTKVCKHWFDEDGCCTLSLDLEEPQTEQPLASGEYNSNSENAVERYRDYYRDVKKQKDWFGYNKARNPPDWL